MDEPGEFWQAFSANTLGEKTGIVVIKIEANYGFPWGMRRARLTADQLGSS